MRSQLFDCYVIAALFIGIGSNPFIGFIVSVHTMWPRFFTTRAFLACIQDDTTGVRHIDQSKISPHHEWIL